MRSYEDEIKEVQNELKKLFIKTARGEKRRKLLLSEGRFKNAQDLAIEVFDLKGNPILI